VTGWLPLYLRSRRLPAALAVSLAAVVVTWAAWSATTDRRQVDQSLTVLTVVLALAPAIPTLAGDDDVLESTAALRWRPRRAVHLVACFGVVAAALAVTRATGAWFGPTGEVVRDSAGLTGLIGLSAALLGTRIAWAPPIGWAAIQVIFGHPAGNGILFWLMQPAGSRPAAVTAAMLFAGGVLAYAVRPGPPAPPGEATMGQ
jgi:hypothetical protein